MKLDNIVPWGRSLHEYTSMFSLSENDFSKKILGCGDGPACFNAEITKNSGDIISVDPVYQFSAKQIRSRIDAVYPHIMSEMKKNHESYIWKDISSVNDLGKIRMASMETFLNDYDNGKKSGRYLNASLPNLPFKNHAFDLALCSHYLFLYSEHVDEAHHIASLLELCRVAKEVRVYPLISLDGSRSRHLDAVISVLKNKNIDVFLQPVEYQFQKGANEMLVAKCI